MKGPFDIDKDEMRKMGYKVIDLIVDHLSNLDIKSPVKIRSRADMDELLMEQLPKGKTEFDTVLNDITSKVLVNTNYLNHPNYLAYVPSPSNYVSSLADLLATAYNVFTGGWSTASGPAEVEIVTINWLLELFGLPKMRGGGIFTSGGSMANMTALATARSIKGDGILYFSDQTHSSIRKGAKILGFKDDQIRIIKTNKDYQINIVELQLAITEDLNKQKTPLCIIANAGTTNTGAIDDLIEIVDLCSKYNIWMHVDAAYGGGIIMSTPYKFKLSGIEKANSITVDPHKWFFQPYEMGCVLVRDFTWLTRSFRENPEYLKGMSGLDEEVNFHELGLQLTRRFRALKLYTSLKVYGLNAFDEAVTYSVNLIKEFEELLQKERSIELFSDGDLAIINFRYNPGNIESNKLDELNSNISESLLSEGNYAVLTTRLKNCTVLRVCSTNPETTMESLKNLIRDIIRIGKNLA